MPNNDLNLTINVTGEQQVVKTMRGYLGRVSNLQPFFERIAVDFKATEREIFREEGAVDGESAWAPLDARYKAWKLKRFGVGSILARTGGLFAAAVHPTVEITPTQLTLTVDSPLAMYHQGLERPATKVPRRPFVTITTGQKRRWNKFLRETIWDEGQGG